MVSKKRIHYGGLDRFQAPVVPKAPRSVRRRIHRKSSEGSEICAFELLAAVAGKLLQESESSTSSTAPEGKEQISIPKDSVKQEPLEVKSKHVRLEYLDQGSCAESEFVPEPTNLELKLEPPLKELLQSDNDSGLEHASVVTTSDLLQKVGVDLKLETSGGKNGVNDNNPEGGLPIHGDLCDVKLGINTAGLQTESIGKQSGDLTAVKTCSLGDTVTSCIHPHVLNKSYSSVHLPFYRDDPVPSACFPGHRGNVKIGIRDDDENSFSSNQHRSKMRPFRSQSRAGYRRMRKMLTSRYWKVGPKLKDYELSNTASGGVKPFYHDMKNNYMRERSASKRRKLFHHNSLRTAYVEESISNLPEKSANGDQRHPPAASNRAAGVTSSVNNHKGSIQSKDSHVKLSIKSLKVPELYIEVPETATVGSLKRTVMEAITAILGSELHVGVLLQGKKVRDENRTLQQTGISENSDTLGFALEPIFPQASPSSVQKEPPLSPPCDTHQHPSRSPANPIMGVCPNSSMNPPPATSLDHQVEKKQERVSLPEETLADSRALVPVTEVNVEALSIVPLNHKPTNKKSELSQRRTRRPFSVSEVEALVEAVETLGTGRWRDVKIRAFDEANHRTYVDLKDKWKTLVHTASISPQQRRGEPVPQDLLDRVLAAHGYWSQPHVKHQIEPLQTLGTPVNRCLEFEP